MSHRNDQRIKLKTIWQQMETHTDNQRNALIDNPSVNTETIALTTTTEISTLSESTNTHIMETMRKELKEI